ncbi:MAG: hypothetical protein KKG54_14445 [Alphaproteobacteria bacterium]|uniref:hypothetical protein n=1 Tax=Brevundimonas sp. TaxID=1871086 RepID=UPI0017DA71F3|nr:hypothetical protein [Brevundimonas sp.]MBA3048744.1 hypothetical protein [Brevundimonas sp.]MBU3971998.1 hypothetical protein [Alphaproteobacteria bacterium]MBU4040523.1 hypothetical protein [Alphaproteobacteria bacterium]MBU4135073.1 hypothetical protein [Alphaproteobacteria bacterium]
MAFSATDAAFEGFRVVRRQPMALIFWALFYLVVMVAALAMVGGSVIGLMGAAETLEQSGATSFEDVMPVLSGYMAIFAVILPVSLIASAMIYAAVARAVLRPSESAFGYLRLGMDEVRVLVVSIVLTILFIVLSFVVFGIVGMVAGMSAAADMPALWLVVVLLVCAAIALFIWLAVRLSLAIPITMAERRIAIFDSFAVTKGRFWPLLGMALLAFVMSIVVSLLGSLVAMPIQLATGGIEGLAGLEGESIPTILQAAWPAIAAWVVINAVISALQVAVVYAPFSAAYRDIKGGQPNAAVFD